MENARIICVPVQYANFTKATNLSKYLSSFLLQNWSLKFEDTLKELRLTVVHVNSTRVDLSFASGLSSWLTSTMDHPKEWAGIRALTGLLVLVSLVCLWFLCKIRVTQRCNAAMIIQAFTAIEAGQTPTGMVSHLKN